MSIIDSSLILISAVRFRYESTGATSSALALLNFVDPLVSVFNLLLLAVVFQAFRWEFHSLNLIVPSKQ